MFRVKLMFAAAACSLMLCTSFCSMADEGSANYIPNGSFETLRDNALPKIWVQLDDKQPGKTVEVDKTVKVSGQQSIKITKTETSKENWRAGIRVFFNERPFKPDTKYTLSFYIKTEDIKPARKSGGAFVLVFDSKRVLSFPSPPFTGTMRWQKVAYEFTSTKDVDPAKPGSYALDAELSDATGTVWFDDISIVESSAAGQK